MNENHLFQLALGLQPPWEVQSIEFDAEQRRLDIIIDFPRGSVFTCPECSQSDTKAYDTTQKSWRHLNFFQHETYITARVPRVQCDKCGIHLVEVPWARQGSGFTLLFEAMVLKLAGAMPVKRIADLVGEHDTKLWRILQHWVDQTRDEADYSDVKLVGVDETSSKRGHNYVSLFVDLSRSRVLYTTHDRDCTTVDRFRDDLHTHGGDAKAIEEFCCDMSPAFITGITDLFGDTPITFDKFHVMKLLNSAVDQVRREELKARSELKGTRFIWLKNPKNLKKSQAENLNRLLLSDLNLKTVRAYQIRLNFQEFYKQPPEHAEQFLRKWYFWATHSRLEPIKKVAYTIKRHWKGVLRWFRSRVNNGILEGINSLVQAAKAKARGYRSVRNLITMIYIIAGKLEFKLPT
ncbi:ISL3 family transposase [bacterium]|nr:ISL3 family transposase [bacterium]